MFKFITNRPFWVNFLAAIVLGFLLIFLTLQMLGWITKHGEYLTVPAVTGKNTAAAMKQLEDQGFEVIIQDSVYTDTLGRGTVIKQLPDANATVKVNRRVFLTVNRYTPPMIVMPALEGKSLSYALDLLARNHLLLGDTSFRADFMKGSILEQLYKGERIKAGDKIQWGSRISFVIASGLDIKEIPIPDLYGKTFAEGKMALDSLGVILTILSTGTISDSASAYIYRQSPEAFTEEKKQVFIHPGQVMDIYISQKMINLRDSTTETN